MIQQPQNNSNQGANMQQMPQMPSQGLMAANEVLGGSFGSAF